MNNGKTVENTNAATQLLIAFLSAFILPATLKWFGHHLTARDVRRDEIQADHDLLIDCQLTIRIQEEWMNQVSAAVKQLCAKYRENEEIDLHHIEALELELAQRPKLKREE